MNTMLSIFSPVARSNATSWSTISFALRLREKPNRSRRICSRMRSPPGSRHRSSDDPISHDKAPATPESKPIRSNFCRLSEKETSVSYRAHQARAQDQFCQVKMPPKAACAGVAEIGHFVDRVDALIVKPLGNLAGAV